MSGKIVFLNAPPRSGKDSAAEYLAMRMDAKIISYGDFPKAGTHAAFGLNLSPRYFEDCKDKPNDLFFGLTPRQAYIDHAEKYMKPLYGKDIYARMMAKVLSQGRYPLTVVIDCGFEPEVQALIPVYKVENMLIVHIDRPGYTYERFNDSRSRITIPGIDCIALNNLEGELETMLSVLEYDLREWISVKAKTLST